MRRAVHIEDCEGWWLSGCRGSVAEHWRLKPEVSWVRLPAAAGLFHFPLFSPHNIQIHLPHSHTYPNFLMTLRRMALAFTRKWLPLFSLHLSTLEICHTRGEQMSVWIYLYSLLAFLMKTPNFNPFLLDPLPSITSSPPLPTPPPLPSSPLPSSSPPLPSLTSSPPLSLPPLFSLSLLLLLYLASSLIPLSSPLPPLFFPSLLPSYLTPLPSPVPPHEVVGHWLEALQQ